jgi:hypothetical protein
MRRTLFDKPLSLASYFTSSTYSVAMQAAVSRILKAGMTAKVSYVRRKHVEALLPEQYHLQYLKTVNISFRTLLDQVFERIACYFEQKPKIKRHGEPDNDSNSEAIRVDSHGPKKPKMVDVSSSRWYLAVCPFG